MEIADVFAVNKADRDGADKLFSEIRAMLDMVKGDIKPEIFRTVAVDDVGIEELVQGIYAHGERAAASGLKQKKLLRQAESELRAYLVDTIMERSTGMALYDDIVKQIAAKKITPMDGVDELFSGLGMKQGGD